MNFLKRLEKIFLLPVKWLFWQKSLEKQKRMLKYRLSIPDAVFEESVKRHGGQNWYYTAAFKGFHNRRFATDTLDWLAANLPKESPVLETGAGAGCLTFWLAENGFKQLDAFDYAPAAVSIANEMIQRQKYPINFWLDNGLDPCHLKQEHYKAIISIDWLYLREVPDFAMNDFLRTYHSALQDGGVLLLELVDDAFNNVSWNMFSSQDLEKPESERRPSEYKLRFSTDQIDALAKQTDFRILHVIDRTMESVPRKVYVLQKISKIISQKNRKDFLFRNDDVTVDTPLSDFKQFCNAFHKNGFQQLHGVTLYGRQHCIYRYKKWQSAYKGQPPFCFLSNEQIRELTKGESIESNTDLIKYLNSIPDEIAFHGLYHTHFSQMSYQEQFDDFEKGLSILKKLFPKKKIQHFIAPFNETNADTYKVAAMFGLEVLAMENSVHFEKATLDLLPNIWYRYHHHRFYADSIFYDREQMSIAAVEKALTRCVVPFAQ